MTWNDLIECLSDRPPAWVRDELDRLTANSTPVVWQPDAGQDLSFFLYDLGRSPLPLKLYPEGNQNAVFLMSDCSELWQSTPREGYAPCTAEYGRLNASLVFDRVWSTSRVVLGKPVSISFCDITIFRQLPGLGKRRCFMIYANDYTESVYSMLYSNRISVAAVVLVSQPHIQNERWIFRTREHLLGQLRRDEAVVGPVEYCLHDRTGEIKPEVGVTREEDPEPLSLDVIAQLAQTNNDEDEFEYMPIEELTLRQNGYGPTNLVRHGWGRGGVRLWRRILN